MEKVIVGRCLLQNILSFQNMKSIDLSDKTSIFAVQISYYINNKKIMSLKTAITIACCPHYHVEELYLLELPPTNFQKINQGVKF